MIPKHKQYYTIAEIRRMTGNRFSRWTIKRLLDRMGIQYVRAGRKVYIPRQELAHKWTNFFDTVQEYEDWIGSDNNDDVGA